MSTTSVYGKPKVLPLLELIHPHEYAALLLAASVLGVGAGLLGVQLGVLPIWGAVVVLLVILLVPAIPKWNADRKRYGTLAMLVCILVLTQGFHTVEHLAQWVQYHLLGWEMRAAVGLLSPANAEWVHFIWNWLVLLTIMALIGGGVRNRWMWLLLAWASAHTFEHTYMFMRHLQTLEELHRLDIAGVTAQGLPGILGQDGWLMRSEWTRSTFICRLPGLTTAPRLDVHFWWNIGEVILLLPAANTYMARLMAQHALQYPTSASVR